MVGAKLHHRAPAQSSNDPRGDRPVRTKIDLLITDVGLPGGMNGRQVADAARVARLGLTLLFITGYAENAVVGNGHLEKGMSVVTKPLSVEALSGTIHELIT